MWGGTLSSNVEPGDDMENPLTGMCGVGWIDPTCDGGYRSRNSARMDMLSDKRFTLDFPYVSVQDSLCVDLSTLTGHVL